jgi:lipoprotein-anchoring transpeptidase ErfK/SrfK
MNIRGLRRVISGGGALIICAALVWPTSVGVSADVSARSTSSPYGDVTIAPELLPEDLGQSAAQVYIPQTGHSVGGLLLDYWRANGAAAVYGNPISEPFEASNGLLSQAFERGILQYSPEWAWTDDPTVRLMPIGAAAAPLRDAVRSDGRRTGSDRRMTAWQPGAGSDGGRLSEVTGFRIAGDFVAWYDAHEGQFYLGEPLSEPHRARGVTVQYFAGGVLMDDGEGVSLLPIPAEQAERIGFDTEPIEQGDLPDYDEDDFVTARNPADLFGILDNEITGRKRIEVSISEQTLRAYEGDTLVLETLVSTGLEPNTTEIGAFHVRIKFEEQDMSGFTSATGEVLSTGDSAENGTIPSGEQYLVEDVPNILYINYQAEALHGAYWHDNFGTPMSHGCINLPVDVSDFIFQWAPLGTAVTVSE